MRLVPERFPHFPRPLPRPVRATAAFVLLALTTVPAAAQREDQGLQLGCADDYFRLCIGVDPNSPEADRCMMRNRSRLSPKCRSAIGDYDKRTGSKSLNDD